MRYDIAIVGSGPAGLSAAVNAKIRNKKIILFGNENLSNKLQKAPEINNYLGFYEIRDNIIPRLDRKAYVEGFIDGRLKNFAEKFNEINRVKIKRVKKRTIDIQYSIKAKIWLNKFRGIATKYLDHYLSLRLFEYKKELFLNDKKEEFSLKPEINTYISWKNIKSKILLI